MWRGAVRFCGGGGEGGGDQDTVWRDKTCCGVARSCVVWMCSPCGATAAVCVRVCFGVCSV